MSDPGGIARDLGAEVEAAVTVGNFGAMTEDDGSTGKKDGMDRVDANADLDWKTEAYNAVLRIAAAQEFFTPDDVRAEIALTGATTHDDRALGPIMLRCAREGLIEKMEIGLSVNPSRHRGHAQRWRSLVVGKITVPAQRHRPPDDLWGAITPE